MHPVFLDHFIHELLGHVRLAFVIAIDDLGLHTTQASPDMLHAQFKGILHGLPNNTASTRKRHNETHLDLFCGYR